MVKNLIFILILMMGSKLTYSQSLEVHEWGTFTVAQNDQGETLVGVNTDDEPLPPFVYKKYFGINKNEEKQISGFGKSLPRYINRKMRMRLETPVVYFYPKENMTGKDFDFQAEFINGVISEVYPKTFDIQKEGPKLESPLSQAVWKNITITDSKNFPITENPVWLEPRKVKAKSIQVGEETEKYLFYRGLGENDIPLHVVTNRDSKKIEIFSEEKKSLVDDPKYSIENLWYVNVDFQGKIVYKKLNGFTVDSNLRTKKIDFSSEFTKDEKNNDYQSLFSSMKDALVKEGLFVEEAVAMLKTWEHAYFKQPGSRIFYMVPRVWVDKNLPIKVSVDSKIERAMIGRIEIISDYQNEILQDLRNSKMDQARYSEYHVNKSILLTKPDAKITIDSNSQKFYDNYIKLGRFRDAIINDSHKNKANANLAILMKHLHEG